MNSFLSKLLIIIVICNISKNEDIDKGYEKLLQWGLKNSLNITNKIRLMKEKDTKQYLAKNLIPEGEQIMDIPPEIMMNVNRSLKLLNKKSFRKAYNLYIHEDKINEDVLKDEYHLDQSFLAYILYIVNHKHKAYEKNKFYQFYEPMFYMFEDNLDSLPFYYSSEQMRFFLNTSFGSVFEILSRYINGEATIFEKKVFNKTIIYEDYLRYRIFSIQKSYEVNKTINIVPFLDYIKKSYKNINCDFEVKDKHVIIKAKQNIFPGEELVLKPVSISNQHRFIFFGDTFDEIMDKFPSYSIPSVIPHFITDKPVNIDMSAFGERARVDLAEFDYFSKVLGVYKKIARSINEDDSEYGAYSLLLKYLLKIKSNFDYINYDNIRNAFYKRKDYENVKRIIDGEKAFMERKINVLKVHMKNIKNKEKEREKSYNDTEDVNDL